MDTVRQNAAGGGPAEDPPANATARQLRATIASIAQGVNIIDADGRVVLMNHGFVDLYGFPPELAVPGTPLADFVRFRLEREGVRGADLDARVALRVDELMRAEAGQFEEQVADGRIVQVRRQRLEGGLLVSTYSDVTEARRREREMARASEALKASEERFRSIVEDQSEFISRVDPGFIITFVNQAYARQLGRPREALVGTSVLDLMSPRQRQAFTSQLAQLTPARPTVRYTMETTLPDGSAGWEEWADRALFDPQGRLVEYQSVGRDITEERRQAAELQASEERLRTIAEGVPVPLAISRADLSAMLFANERALEIYSVPPGAGYREILSAWVDPQDRLDLVRDTLRDGRVEGREVQLRRGDGSAFWALVSSRALTYGGEPAILTTSIDITDRRQMEQALRASEARFRAIIEDQTEFISRFTPQFVFTFVNGALAQHIGRPPEAIIGTSLLDLMTEPQQQRFIAQLSQLTPDNPVVSYEVETTQPGGREGYEQWSERALFDADGRLLEYQSVGRDITQQKIAEAELRETEEQLRTIAEGVPLPIAIFRLADGVTVFANARSREAFGLRIGAHGRIARAAWIRPEERDRMVERLLREGRIDGFEAQLRRTDGRLVWVLISARLLTLGGEQAMLTAVADITERREMEQRLKESEQRFRTIAEAHPVPMVIARLADRALLFVNTAFRELFGFVDPDERVDPAQLFEPGARDRIFLDFAEGGRLDEYEVNVRRRDGTPFPVSITSRRIDYQGTPASVTSITDLSEKKRAEAEIARQREALHQSEKISALGALLAGVAHELNNPLSVVVGQSVLLEELAAEVATRERAVKVRTAAERCARIIRTFLSMARSRPMERGPVDLPRLVDAALELLGYGLRTAGIMIERDFAPRLPAAYGDPDQLHQVLTNLIVNAQQALQEVEPPRRLRISVRREGGRARIEVADNGPGIDPGLGSRVFEPFVTTKPRGTGTGIGLSVCQSIISAHDGTIAFTSSPGQGTIFTLRLPLLQSAAPAAEARPAGAADAPVGRILVVDDEPDIGEMYADILRGVGHEVGIATRGRDALAMIEGGSFDLVLSDLRMPDLDGAALYRALAGRGHPLAARVIIITGDALSHQTQRLLGDAEVEVLEKPIDPAVLTARVHERLKKAP